MRAIPVRTEVFAGVTCVMLPEAKLVDIDTGEVRKDRRSGETVYAVGVCAMHGRDSSVLQVSVVGEPKGLVLGGPVRLVDLVATPWERDGRSGIAWRAAAIVPVDGPAPTAAPAVAPASGGGRKAGDAG